MSMKDLNWGNTDVIIGNRIHYGVRFQVVSGYATVVAAGEVVAEGPVESWGHGEANTWLAGVAGAVWEVLKLRCPNCEERLQR